MAILFDWYENPKTKDKQGEELTLHPRIKLNGSTTTDELRRHIQEYCSLTETDVLAVLDALSHFVGRELGEQGFALPDVAEFEKLINDRTRGILICNPNNPTGLFVEPDWGLAFLAKCRERGITVVLHRLRFRCGKRL